MDVTQERVDALASELREIYKTNDGPRILAELFAEFPNPRKVLGVSGKWSMAATSSPSSR